MLTQPVSRFLLLILATACAQGGADTAQQANRVSTGTIQGRVRTLDGDPVVGAAVSAGGVEDLADDDGAFSLEDVPIGARVPLVARSDETTAGGAAVSLGAGQTVQATLTVLPLRHATLVDAAAGGTVETDDGLRIDFTPGAVVDAQGEPVSGEVDVAYALFDAVEELAAAPGNLEYGVDGAVSGLLLSRGMVSVTLTQGGEELNLGEPVEVSFPLMAGADASGPAGSLYGFDEQTGLWTYEAEGTEQNGRFVFSAPHFSLWNDDVPGDYTGCMQGTLTLDGEPLVGSLVGIWFDDGAHTNLTTGSDVSGQTTSADPPAGFVQSPALGGDTVSAMFVYDDEEGRHYWTIGPVLIPEAGAGCYDFGTLEANGTDLDGDGQSIPPYGDDCDDTSAQVGPHMTETCDDSTGTDGLDNDCDGTTDPVCGAGEMFYEYGLDADPAARTCDMIWGQTWTQSAETCPDCLWAAEVHNVLDADASVLGNDCWSGATDFSWLLGYDPDFYGSGEARFWVNYYGEWYPTYAEVSFDAATGALSWVHQGHDVVEASQGDGTWLTDHWGGTATFAP